MVFNELCELVSDIPRDTGRVAMLMIMHRVVETLFR